MSLKDQQHLNIVTFNVSGLPYPPHLKLRMKAIASYFDDSNVDVLMLQEVHTYTLLRFLKNNLPSFAHGTYVRTLLGPKAGLVIFSRLPLQSVRFTGVTQGTKKGMLTTKLHDITLVNLHLSANKDGDWSPGNHYHAKQSIQLTDVARHVHQLPGKLVVGGDFNLARHSDIYDSFVERTRLHDSAGANDVPSFHTAFLPPDRPAFCIDFIFTRQARSDIYNQLFTIPVELAPGIDGYVSSHKAIYSGLDFHD